MDPANWLCRVKTGDLETNWINWLTLRAGNTRTWWKPSIGEQVVLLSLGGNLETAFALPAIYFRRLPAAILQRTAALPCSTTAAGSVRAGQRPAADQKHQSIRIEAADGIQLITDQLGVDASRTLINSQTVMNGDVTQGGGKMSSNGVVADAHAHDGVKSGGDTSGGPH